MSVTGGRPWIARWTFSRAAEGFRFKLAAAGMKPRRSVGRRARIDFSTAPHCWTRRLPRKPCTNALRSIESALGRQRHERWGPRTLDLDLLLYDRVILETPSLTLPHPRMAWRRFVLEPAAEIAGWMIHPHTGWTVARLLTHLETAYPYFAVVGPIAARPADFARRLAAAASAHFIADPMEDADIPGDTAAAELECLEARALRIARDCLVWTPRRDPAVSAFWIGESLARARLRLAGPEQTAFLQRWEHWTSRVVPPKLIVVLAPPENPRSAAAPSPAARAGGRLYAAVLAEARQPDRGPLLILSTDRLERAVEESAAAIQAMHS